MTKIGQYGPVTVRSNKNKKANMNNGEKPSQLQPTGIIGLALNYLWSKGETVNILSSIYI
jgi:hypothetical protein